MSKLPELKELVAEGPVVFYDGVCGLCDRAVKTLIRLDKGHRLRYTTLQGDTAQRLLGEQKGESGAWSMLLADEAGLHDRSSAALRSIAHTGGLASIVKVFLIVPKPLRDAVYKFIAQNRYRWFGQVDACMLPTPALRKRFLP